MAKKNNNIPLLLMILLLLGSTIGASYMWYNEKELHQNCDENSEVKNNDINELLFELTKLEVAYEELESQADELNVDKKNMKESIKALKSQLIRAMENEELSEKAIASLKREIKSLRRDKDDLEEEVIRIKEKLGIAEDKNLALQEDNQMLKAANDTLKIKVASQQTEFSSLKDKYDQVNQMKALDLELTFLNKKKKATRKARSVNFFNISFKTGENQLRDGEVLEYYIVVKDKNSNRVIQSQGSQRMDGGTLVTYTARVSFIYDGNNRPISIEIPLDEEVTGTYEVIVYTDNALVGRSYSTI